MMHMHSGVLVSLLLAVWCALTINAATVNTPEVSFSNVVYSASNDATSVDITFPQPVLSFPLQRLQLRDGEANPISLATATLTPKAGNTVWTLSKSSGFLPYARTNVTLSFNNIPASVCASPVSPVGGTATTVVGTGTPASCTEAALTAAIQVGGLIKFSCGPDPVTITVTSVKNVPLTTGTTIDGGGLVTLSGGGKTRILALQSTFDKLTPRLTLQYLRFTGGYTTYLPTDTNATSQGGAAVFRNGGALTIISCDFFNNQGPPTGQDVAGGAVYSIGGDDTIIVGSTFSNNKCSNGGAIGNLFGSLSIYNSIVNNNQATGLGANPGNGGNGGAISMDGEGVNLVICGTTVSYNTAGALGGGMFRVGYNYVDSVTIDRDTFAYNKAQGADICAINNSSDEEQYCDVQHCRRLRYQSHYTLSGMTIANNTATKSLGGGLGISAGSGTISDSTIIGNHADDSLSFGAGVAGGDGNTILARSIVAYSVEGNIYVALSCFGQMSEGGNNFQFPAKRLDGNNDALCTPQVNVQDPMLGAVGDNGCVTWTAKALPGSPASSSGARCAPGTSPTPVVVYSNGQIVSRGPFAFTFPTKNSVTATSSGTSATSSVTPSTTSRTTSTSGTSATSAASSASSATSKATSVSATSTTKSSTSSPAATTSAPSATTSSPSTTSTNSASSTSQTSSSGAATLATTSPTPSPTPSPSSASFVVTSLFAVVAIVLLALL